MKPAEYRKYTVMSLMVNLGEWTIEGYIKMMKKKFNVLISYSIIAFRNPPLYLKMFVTSVDTKMAAYGPFFQLE